MLFQPPILSERAYLCDCRVGEFSFPGHWHNEIELLYCIQGCGDVRVGKGHWRITEGQLCILNSAEEHEYRAIGDKTETLIIEFGQALLGNRFNELASCYFAVRLLTLQEDTIESDELAKIRQLLINISEEFRQETAESRWLMMGYLYELIALLYRVVPREEAPSAVREYKMRHIDAISPVIDYVSEHYGKDITLREASDLAGYERKSFCRIFKATIGRSFHNYLNEYRIRQAKLMLKGSGMRISEIGEICGIPDPRGFCRVFRNFAGMTPSEYRRQFGKKISRNENA